MSLFTLEINLKDCTLLQVERLEIQPGKSKSTFLKYTNELPDSWASLKQSLLLVMSSEDDFEPNEYGLDFGTECGINLVLIPQNQIDSDNR